MSGSFRTFGSILITYLATTALTLAILFLPEMPFLAGEAIIDFNPASNLDAYQESAANFRLALSSQYFNWATVSVAIGGATMWRFSGAHLDRYILSVLFGGFILSCLSIILGVAYLEIVTRGLSLGLKMLNIDGFIKFYPSIQFFCVAEGFVLTALATLAATLKQSRSNAKNIDD